MNKNDFPTMPGINLYSDIILTNRQIISLMSGRITEFVRGKRGNTRTKIAARQVKANLRKSDPTVPWTVLDDLQIASITINHHVIKGWLKQTQQIPPKLSTTELSNLIQQKLYCYMNLFDEPFSNVKNPVATNLYDLLKTIRPQRLGIWSLELHILLHEIAAYIDYLTSSKIVKNKEYWVTAVLVWCQIQEKMEWFNVILTQMDPPKIKLETGGET